MLSLTDYVRAEANEITLSLFCPSKEKYVCAQIDTYEFQDHLCLHEHTEKNIGCYGDSDRLETQILCNLWTSGKASMAL